MAESFGSACANCAFGGKLVAAFLCLGMRSMLVMLLWWLCAALATTADQNEGRGYTVAGEFAPLQLCEYVTCFDVLVALL